MIDIAKEVIIKPDEMKDKIPDFSRENNSERLAPTNVENILSDKSDVFSDILDNQDNDVQQEFSEVQKIKMDDNGNVFMENGRLLPNIEYTVNGYDYKTDDKGRIIEASGNLRLSGEPRQPLNETGVGGEDKRDTDDRGHLIGDRFGGSNTIENLVAQDSNLNRGAYKSIENECAEAIKEGKEVSMSVEVEYEGDSERPSSFTVTYTIDGTTYEKTFLNEKQGG